MAWSKLTWLVIVLCFLYMATGGPPGQGRAQPAYGGGSSRGRWGGSWQWNQQSWAPHPEVVVRVENDRKGRNDKSKKKKRRSPSSSSVSDSSAASERKSKKRFAGKRQPRREEPSGLSTQEAEELKEFRRQAEIQKIREEVLRSMPSNPKARKSEAEKGAEVEQFTPKTKKLLQAQTRILTSDGVCKRILTDDAASWEDVHVQLNNSSAPDIKTLCGQLCEQTPRTKAECISKIIDALQDHD